MPDGTTPPTETRWDLQVRTEPNGVLLYVGRNWIATVVITVVAIALVVAS